MELSNLNGYSAVINPVPIQRIIDRLESYMSRKDYEGAEKHLLYWLKEAKLGHDTRGELLICNELVGFFRKTDHREQAFKFGDQALNLVNELGLEGSISAGTTYINVATAYNAFGEYERSLSLFEKAKAVYEANREVPPHLLGGLFNNMALTYKELERYDEAFACFEKAMSEMEKVKGGALEQAITCLNMADAVAARDGLEEGETRIYSLLDKACNLLHDSSVPHDGYYAFVCEKCSPSFLYYGYFAAAEEFQKEAKQIYERA